MTNNVSEEILDLVDINDNIIGTVARSVANSDPNVIHREVAIIIFDRDNRVLLQRRDLSKKIAPGVWTTSSAGHVTHGFTPLEISHRELTEELGFDTDLEFIEKELDKQQNETRIIYWYKGEFPEGSSIKIEPGEVTDARFISKSELEEFQKAGNIIGRYSLKHIIKYWSGC